MSNNSPNLSLAPLSCQYYVSNPVTAAQKSALESVFTDEDKEFAKFLREKEAEAGSPDNENEDLSENVKQLWQSLYRDTANLANKKICRRAAKSHNGTSAANTAVPQCEDPKQADGTMYAALGCPLGNNQSNNNGNDAKTRG
jgi:hypothetical protein